MICPHDVSCLCSIAFCSDTLECEEDWGSYMKKWLFLCNGFFQAFHWCDNIFKALSQWREFLWVRIVWSLKETAMGFPMKTPTIVLRGCLKKEHLFMGFFHVKQGSHALLVLNMWYDSRKNEWSMICELRMRETKLEKKTTWSLFKHNTIIFTKF